MFFVSASCDALTRVGKRVWRTGVRGTGRRPVEERTERRRGGRGLKRTGDKERKREGDRDQKERSREESRRARDNREAEREQKERGVLRKKG